MLFIGLIFFSALKFKQSQRGNASQKHRRKIPLTKVKSVADSELVLSKKNSGV